MEDPNRAILRRRNIVAVQPILRALRTNSLGKWTAAAGKREQARRYSEQLAHLLAVLLPHLRFRPKGKPGTDTGTRAQREHVVLAVIGTERGLCGRFNLTLVEYCEQHLRELGVQAVTVEVVSLGTRVIRLMRSRKHVLHSAITFPPASLPPFEISVSLTRQWLERYERYALDAVDVVYCEYRGGGSYTPCVTRVIPPLLPFAHIEDTEPWPSFEVETEPSALCTRVVEQLTAVSFYDLLLKSSVAEHAARSQLMDAATQNAQRALDELSLSIQLARQHAITSEMQELAAGAGLLKRQRR